MTGEEEYPRYRWLLLVMGWAMLCLTAYNSIMLVVRFDLLLPVAEGGLGLSKTQFYLCVTGPYVPPIIMALVSGLLTDRIGVKRVILYGAIITCAGALLRLVATGFIDLLIYCMIMGVGLATLSGNVPKLVGMWFPVRQVYLGIALFATSLGIGPFLALGTGAMWASYFQGFLVMGLLLVVMCVVWAIWAKDRKEYREEGKEIIGVPFRESLLAAMKSRHIWLILLPNALVLAVVATWSGGVPLVLVETKGVSEVTAGLVISLSVVGYIIGIVLWSWLAEKWGYMKPILAVCMPLSGVTGLLTYILAPGIGMWLFGIFPGLFMGAGPPLVMQMALRVKGIGIRYAGAAMGLIASGANVASFVMLPFMYEPMWRTLGAIYAGVFLCLVLWLAGALFVFAPELGRKSIERMLREALSTTPAS